MQKIKHATAFLVKFGEKIYLKNLMMKRKLFLLVVLLLAVVLGFAQVNPQAPLELDKKVLTGKLENGLTYYVMHNEKPAQRADFYIVTNVGAVQEAPDQDGLAHFLEHMCFNGTKHFPGKGIISYMESIGCAFGANINAGTGFEQTMYMLNNVPVTREGIIDSSLLILFDWSAYVTNDPAEIEAERGVILEEKRTRDGSAWRQTLAMRKALFKGSALENVSLIGSEDNLKNFKPESLVNFYKTWYRPDMQSVIVVGDVDAEAVVDKIKTLFGQLPAAENPKAKDKVVVPDNATPIVTIFTDKETDRTTVMIASKSQAIPAQYKGLGLAMLNDLMEGLIGTIINERLQDISRKADAPFLGASAGFGDISYDLHAFMGDVAAKEGEGVKAFAGLMTELERVKRYGFTPDEFDRAKTNILKRYETAKNNAASRQNPQLVDGPMNHFLTGEPYMDPEYEFNTASQYMSMLSVEMLNMAVKQMYGDNNLVIFYSSPQKEGVAVPTEQELVDVLVAVKTAEISAPVVESSNEPLLDPTALAGSNVKTAADGMYGSTIWTLENGMQVIVKPTDYKKDEIMILTVANGGRSILADELIPSFEMNVFNTYLGTTGLGKFSKSQLTKMLAGKVVSVSPYVSDLEHGISVRTSPKDIETAFQLAYLSYTQPRFDPEEFEAGFNRIKALLPNMLKQPNSVFSKALQEALVCNHPRRPFISEEVIAKANLADIEKGYRQLMADQAGLKVYITGNVNLEELKPMVEKYIGSLPVISSNGTAWVDEGIQSPAGEQKKVVVTPMETPKTSVAILYNGKMEKNLENDIKMSLLNGVLDQLYTKTIREDEGGTYGVGVQAQVVGEPNGKYLLLVVFDTDVAKAPKLIELAKSGLADIAKNGPNAEYVAKSKENLVKAFPEKQINNSYWHNMLYQYYSLERDNYTGYLEAVEKAGTPETIQKFVQEILSSGNVLELLMNPAE